MIYIQVSEEIEELWESLEVPYDALEAAAKEALFQADAPGDAELTIMLGSDELLRELNQKYLDINAPTDVLSFSADHTDPDTAAPYLGDLVISLAQAMAQAGSGLHPLQDELQLLIVHGVLHLMGYDHAEDEEKAAMQAAQDAILRTLGSSAQTTL